MAQPTEIKSWRQAAEEIARLRQVVGEEAFDKLMREVYQRVLDRDDPTRENLDLALEEVARGGVPGVVYPQIWPEVLDELRKLAAERPQ